MGGHVLVGAIDVGLVTAGAGDRAAQLVGDPHRGGAAEVLHHVDVRVAPVRQLLRLGRFGVGEAAGAEHGEEQLDGPERTRAPVDQARPLAREVDEGLFAGAVHLPHRGPQPPRPLPVDLAELGVAVAARMDAGVLLPEQLQRDTVPLSSRWIYAQSGRARLRTGAGRGNRSASSAASSNSAGNGQPTPRAVVFRR